MNGLSFEYPWVLMGFFLFIPLILFWVLRSRFFAPAILRGRSNGRRYFLSNLFFWIFLACCIIALAGPRWGKTLSKPEYRRGLDAVFAVDVSRSMEVEDVSPPQSTRLERGLVIAREIVSAAPEIRFGAAIGKGKGLAAVPLTWDTEAVLSFLEGLSGSSITGRGTDLESLLDAAGKAFQNSSQAKRVIILITDGEALSGSLRDALERRAGEGAAVVALAVGSDEGGPVPKDPEQDGDEIISRRNSAALRYAAERTGGLYVDGNGDRAGQTAAQITTYLTSLAPESESPGRQREMQPRWQLFILAAIPAFGASRLCLLRRSKNGTGAGQ
ncbi:MAG: VWA domain-containing protein [Treponema sp.]|jgi:Ca-activated chloride channel family protein|nr:VWA domain-containing protein [Treponema sp.]